MSEDPERLDPELLRQILERGKPGATSVTHTTEDRARVALSQFAELAKDPWAVIDPVSAAQLMQWVITGKKPPGGTNDPKRYAQSAALLARAISSKHRISLRDVGVK